MENREYIIMNFSYIDEFGQESNLDKTICSNVITDIDVSPFDLLVDNFKLFLLGAGFGQNLVDTIQIIENK